MEDIRVSAAFRYSRQAVDLAAAEAEKPGLWMLSPLVRKGRLEMPAGMGEEAP